MRFLRLGPTGLRGAVGSALTTPLAIRFASAFGTWLNGGTVAVCTDTRTSSPMFKAACLSGLLSCGCNVLDLGVCPSAVLHFAVKRLGLEGGLIIGPGHHQEGWNAIVAVSAGGACLTPIQTQEMLDIYHGGVFQLAPWDRGGKIFPAPEDMFDRYLDDLSALVDKDRIAQRHFRVVMDFCNGSGSVLSEKIAARLNLDAVPINDLQSGSLPHDPEPRPRSSAQVKSIMRPLKADAGFVFSSDVGRVAVVTNSAETLSEEYTIPLVADNVLAKAPPHSSVATNWCTTRTLDRVAKRHHATLWKGEIGEAFTSELMIEKDAVLAGDGSGGVIVSPNTAGFDGFAAMFMILESMALKKASCSDLIADLPRYHIIKLSLPCPSVKAYPVLRELRNMFPDAEVTEADGLRFDWTDGWVHVRISRTEPILRMILEWKDRKIAMGKAMHIRAALERMIAQ